MSLSRRAGVAIGTATAIVGALFYACAPASQAGGAAGASAPDAASRTYVAPGGYDDFYAFMSGGFSGQVGVYGLPSGRLLKVVPVFSQNAENGYGYNDETKPMLNTSFGFVPWDDTHHPSLSQTGGMHDGRWLFINANNTPRFARIDLTKFETSETVEIPNTAGNHGAPFVTENTEYLIGATRFSIPIPHRKKAVDEKLRYISLS